MSDQIKPKMNRRRFVGSLGLLGALPTINPLSIFSKAKTVSTYEGSLMKCKPYLQAANTDSIIVRWITKVPAHSWVEYGENADNLNLKARQVKVGMVQVNNTLHAIEHGVHPAIPGKYNYPVVIGGGKKDGSRTIIKIKADQQSLRLTMTDDSGILVGELNIIIDLF